MFYILRPVERRWVDRDATYRGLGRQVTDDADPPAVDGQHFGLGQVRLVGQQRFAGHVKIAGHHRHTDVVHEHSEVLHT